MIARICSICLVFAVGGGWTFTPPNRPIEKGNRAESSERPSLDAARVLDADTNLTNVRCMLPGSCRAGSRIPDRQALGGFAASSNMPKAIQTDEARRAEAVYLLAEPRVRMPLHRADGIRLVLVNPADKTMSFATCDGHLAIVQEAVDESGKWRPIEYPVKSFCGNSYHRVFLGPDEYWAFSAPRYTGIFKTTLRFRLTGARDLDLISNEFEGSINPEQFLVKQDRPWTPPGE